MKRLAQERASAVRRLANDQILRRRAEPVGVGEIPKIVEHFGRAQFTSPSLADLSVGGGADDDVARVIEGHMETRVERDCAFVDDMHEQSIPPSSLTATDGLQHSRK